MHPLMILVAFTVAALVTYAVVLGLLTAASASSGERWLHDEEAVEDGRADRGEEHRDSGGVMLTTRSSDRRSARVPC